MRSVTWRRVVATTVAVPLLLVGGCGADEPVVRPSSTASSEAAVSPTPSPSPTIDLTRLPEQPAAMAEPTTDGAIAAATYVLELYGYSFASGDLGPWRAMTADTCQLCASVERGVEEMLTAGQSSTGSTVSVLGATSTEISDDEWFSVEMQVRQSPSQRMDSEGEVVSEGTGGDYDAVFALSWADGWTVDEMGLEPMAPAATASAE